jgi:hypothetical protein
MYITEKSNYLNYRNEISEIQKILEASADAWTGYQRKGLTLNNKMLHIIIKEMGLSTHTSLFVTGCMNFM